MLANIASLAQSAISPTIPLIPHQRIPVLCSPKQRRVLRSRESRAARRASNQHSLLRSRRLVASFCLDTDWVPDGGPVSPWPGRRLSADVGPGPSDSEPWHCTESGNATSVALISRKHT
jgi:hypothetical protein